MVQSVALPLQQTHTYATIAYILFPHSNLSNYVLQVT